MRPPGAASGWARRGSGPGFAAFAIGLGSPSEFMSDNAILSDIPTPRQAGRIPREQVTKRRARTHHAPVIRADLTLVPDPPADPGAPFLRRSGKRARAKTQPRENPGTASLSAAGAVPGLGAGGRKGRAGRPSVLRRRRARFARRASAPRPARRRGAALAPGASERRCLRQNPAPQRRRRRAARPPLRRRRPAGPAANLLRSGATSPAGRPASTQAGLAPRRRGWTWPWTRTASHPA